MRAIQLKTRRFSNQFSLFFLKCIVCFTEYNSHSYNMKQFLSKTPLTLSFYVCFLLAAFATIFAGIEEAFIKENFGIIFDHLDWSVIYRLITMLIFAGDIPTFGGIAFLMVFAASYEYHEGSKRWIVLMLAGNLAGLMAEYVILYKIFHLTDYYDLAASNSCFAFMGGLFFVVEKKWKMIIAGIITAWFAFSFILLTDNSDVEVAHIAGLVCGVLIQKFYFSKPNDLSFTKENSKL
jgi:hypothetical protein